MLRSIQKLIGDKRKQLIFPIFLMSLDAIGTLIGTTTFLIAFVGVWIGHFFGNRLGNRAGILGGVILILIGVRIFIMG